VVSVRLQKTHATSKPVKTTAAMAMSGHGERREAAGKVVTALTETGSGVIFVGEIVVSGAKGICSVTHLSKIENNSKEANE